MRPAPNRNGPGREGFGVNVQAADGVLAFQVFLQVGDFLPTLQHRDLLVGICWVVGTVPGAAKMAHSTPA